MRLLIEFVSRVKKIQIIIWLVFLQTGLYGSVNYVTLCGLGGQLGSQLFSVAMALGYGWEHGLVPVFSQNAFCHCPGGKENYQNIFYRLPQTLPDNFNQDPPTHVHYAGLCQFPKIAGNVCLCGLRAEFWYFDRYKAQIKEVFGPSEQIKIRLEHFFSEILNHPKSVAVHIRTYHPLRASNHLFLGKEYYINAIESFPDDCLFVIFSDRIDWCKKNLQHLNRKLIFIQTKDHILDFYLMAFCKNIIISNSTFSWWAAYLKDNEEGVVLAPDRWFRHCANTPTEDVIQRKFYPTEWILMPVENDSPCYDLLEYETTSIDEKDCLVSFD